jgi:hypothetical protein
MQDPFLVRDNPSAQRSAVASKAVYRLGGSFLGRRLFPISVCSVRMSLFPLLQLGILSLSFLKDGDVGIGVFPEGEKILVGTSCPYSVS